MASKGPPPQIIEAVGHAAGTSSVQGVGQAVGPSNVGAAATAGATDSGKGATTKPARRGSSFIARGGRRVVNAYPLTELELYTLGIIQGTSAFMFALAGASLGFWLSVKQSIAFAGKDTPKTAIAYWQGLETAGLVAAIIFALLGALAFWFSAWKVGRIIKETDHG